MKIIRTKLVRLTGKKYLMFFGLLFTAPKAIIKEEDLNHERIHVAQMKEMLYVFFYLWYGIEWVIRLLQFWRVGYASYRESKRLKTALRRLNYMAYRNISLEREAYRNEGYQSYLNNRKRFTFLKFVG